MCIVNKFLQTTANVAVTFVFKNENLTFLLEMATQLGGSVRNVDIFL